MIYCPKCDLWGVSEDHAFTHHGVQRTYSASSNFDRPTPCDFTGIGEIKLREIKSDQRTN